MTKKYEQNSPISQDEGIDLLELFAIVWQGKWIILVITFVFAIGSIFYALSLPNIYKSEALLAPASQDQSSRMGGQLGGLAALAGVNLGASGADKTGLAIEVLRSREFIGRFIEKYDLYVPVIAAVDWDITSNELILDDSIYNEKTKEWQRSVKAPRKAKPSTLETYEEFMKLVNITQDATTGMVSVSIEYLSPYLAQQWLEALIKELNEEMRQRDLIEAERSISYLNEQIAKTNLADARAMLYSLIEEQTKTLMLANVRAEYAFKTIDPPVVPELKAKPARAILVVVITFMGGMFSVLIVLLRHSFRKSVKV